MLHRRHLPLLGAGLLASGAVQAQRGWEPQRPVQFIVPAGTGGGADQMARVIQGIVSRHNLMRQPLMVVNKAGGAGAEGFLEAKNARGNPHVLIISLSNLFTTPLSTGVPFSWRDLTPIKMMALDEFVLWVNAASPWNTLAEFLDAAKAGRLRMGGTGSRQGNAGGEQPLPFERGRGLFHIGGIELAGFLRAACIKGGLELQGYRIGAPLPPPP